MLTLHTSNWDGWMFALLELALGVRLTFVGKSSIFFWPVGPILRALGGIPIDRSSPQDLVSQLVDEMKRRERIGIGMAPSGTRSRTEYWKSGFYHLARAANVPVSLGVIDYKKKEGGFGPLIHLTGDVRADMDKIRAFYAGVTPYRPENLGPIRLRSEEQSEF